ncbi:MAG: T9SS type A sorting domain-containing protein [Flavipsychrobacter sp.]|nr:T9SS type A sorting domain-containing protein [Flavipsychrobacter sp.]
MLTEGAAATDAYNTKAEVSVTDITGKVVYITVTPIAGSHARVLIPAGVLQTSGIYQVHTLTGNQADTRETVVY